jgi:hypothetical protein
VFNCTVCTVRLQAGSPWVTGRPRRGRVLHEISQRRKESCAKSTSGEGLGTFLFGAHVLFNIGVNGIVACLGRRRLLDGDGPIENSLPQSGVAASAHTGEKAARCSSQGATELCVLDISFPKWRGSKKSFGAHTRAPWHSVKVKGKALLRDQRRKSHGSAGGCLAGITPGIGRAKLEVVAAGVYVNFVDFGITRNT